MWLDNLKELKKKTGMSTKQIADRTKLPERTVSRILGGESDHPYADTLDLIVKALGYDLGDIFADTKVVVATDELVEIKESVDQVEAERDRLITEINELEKRLVKLKHENSQLLMKLAHKDELLAHKEALIAHKDEIIALHNHYNKLRSGE